jgi:hypothetical protein
MEERLPGLRTNSTSVDLRSVRSACQFHLSRTVRGSVSFPSCLTDMYELLLMYSNQFVGAVSFVDVCESVGTYYITVSCDRCFACPRWPPWARACPITCNRVRRSR